MGGHKGGVDPGLVAKLAGQANILEARLQQAVRKIQELEAMGSQQTTMLGVLGLQLREREELLRAVLPGARLAVAEGMISPELRARVEELVRHLEGPDPAYAVITAAEERKVMGIQFLRDLDSPEDNPSGRLYPVCTGEEQHAAMQRAKAQAEEIARRKPPEEQGTPQDGSLGGDRKVVLA